VIRIAVDVVDALRNRLHLRRLRQPSFAGGFPLDRNMAIAATSDRLLLWSASARPRRIKVFLGAVPRSRIQSATLPYSGGGPWRTLRINTVDGVRLQLQVETGSADRLTSALQHDPQASDGPQGT
jgi:hypothetical protein